MLDFFFLSQVSIHKSVFSHSSDSLQVYLMIVYNILVNTNTRTGIKQICISYWSATLTPKWEFSLLQSSLKAADNHSFKTVGRFSTRNIIFRNRIMQTFWELLAEMAALEEVKTNHWEYSKFSFLVRIGSVISTCSNFQVQELYQAL